MGSLGPIDLKLLVPAIKVKSPTNSDLKIALLNVLAFRSNCDQFVGPVDEAGKGACCGLGVE